MNDVLAFYKLIQATRAQPLYGYALSGIKKTDLSDLAQHHYLVTLTTWSLGRMLLKNGGRVNLEKALEIALFHDLGELFGGDIGMPYAKINKRAHRIAKQFEKENQAFLARQFTDFGDLLPIFNHSMEPTSTEAVVAKIADYIEVTHYKHYLGRMTDGDVSMVESRLLEMVGALKHTKTRKYLLNFISDWANAIRSDDGHELFEFAKKL